jgi:hypothetical protein
MARSLDVPQALPAAQHYVVQADPLLDLESMSLLPVGAFLCCRRFDAASLAFLRLLTRSRISSACSIINILVFLLRNNLWFSELDNRNMQSTLQDILKYLPYNGKLKGNGNES